MRVRIRDVENIPECAEILMAREPEEPEGPTYFYLLMSRTVLSQRHGDFRPRCLYIHVLNLFKRSRESFPSQSC